MKPTTVLLKVADAAEAASVSVDTIKRAIRATDPGAFPPPLKAKRDSKGRLFVRPVDLDAWIDAWPDA